MPIKLFLTATWICAASMATAQQLAMVAGADITGTVSIKALGSSPLVAKHLSDATRNKTQLRPLFAARSARFEAATGLQGEDFLSASFACDIDTLDMTATTPREQVSGLSGLIAIQLAKPLAIEQLKQALKLEYGSPKLAGVSDLTIGGKPGLKIQASSPTDPDLYLTISPDQQVVMIGLNAEALAAGLQRAATQKAIKEPQQLTRMRRALPPGAQIQIAGIVPPGIRNQINTQIDRMTKQAAQNPQMAMGLGFIKLFQGIQSICLGVQLDSGVLLSLSGDLGNEQQAQQASILMNNMLIPMLHAAILRQATPSSPAPDLDGLIGVSAKAANLQIDIRLSAEQIEQFEKQAAARQSQ